MNAHRPAISSLENPLYYLDNFRTVLAWVSRYHADLLKRGERADLERFWQLSTAAQGLLVRLVMRSGRQFRLSKLSYPELGAAESEAAEELGANGWLDLEPEIDLTTLFRLFTRAELLEILQSWCANAGFGKTDSKKRMLETMTVLEPDPAPIVVWNPDHPDHPDRVVEITAENLFERVKLMFFGNLHQDWSEFVLAQLGHHAYEPVMLKPESRAFEQRAEVDIYLQLHHCRTQLDNGETPKAVLSTVPAVFKTNPWLEERRARLLFGIAHLAERQGDVTLALKVYAQSTYSEALVRRLRVMERQQQYREAHALVERGLESPQNSVQQQSLQRIYKRLCKKLSLPCPTVATSLPISSFEINLPQPANMSVEQAAVKSLENQNELVYYVENGLFNGLFALLCWPALYAPLKGAFFHPFHAAPVDLYRDGFVDRRREQFSSCLSLLDTQEYRERIQDNFADKQGISCPFMHWEVLNEEVLGLALDCIPAEHLRLVFDRMLQDLKHHRSGLPDVVRFFRQQKRYELIEVKGPGDRLQDNQRRWFDFFNTQQIPASLCRVNWS